MGNYEREDMESEKVEVNMLMNTNNEESFYDNNSSYYETNSGANIIGNYDYYQSKDYNNFYDFKIKNDFDSEARYNNFTKDPK